jgi:dolichyl-phosphate beta-glucosyltransferase
MLKPLSVIVPAYNEEPNIELAINEISSYLEKSNFDYEIIIINDGSTDRTKEICLKYLDKIKYFENETNKGKGFTVKKGVRLATKQKILFLDTDLSTPIQQVEVLYPFADKYEIVIGSRNLADSNIIADQPFHRRMMGKTFAVITYFFSGLNIKDTQCGFKLFDKTAINDIFDRSVIEGWCFDVELLYIAEKLNYKTKEAPIEWVNHTETSKVQPVLTSIEMLLDLMKIRWYGFLGNYK